MPNWGLTIWALLGGGGWPWLIYMLMWYDLFVPASAATFTLTGYTFQGLMLMDLNARKRLEARSISAGDGNGFLFWALSLFFGLFYQMIQYVFLVSSSNFGYKEVVVGSECNDNFTVVDTQTKTCAWYDIGSNSDQCGAFDKPEVT